MLILACMLALTWTPAAKADSGTPVIFIHGLKGSALVDAQGDTAWVTGLQALALRTPDLRLPLRWFDGQQARDELHATVPLENVRVIPWLLQEEVYGPFLRAMRQGSAPFYAFAYDWRRDNHESLRLLTRFVEQVRAKHNGQKVRIVAHSMGGLITLPLLNAHPDYSQAVAFAGVPFGGGIGFLLDMHHGTATGLNRVILAPEVLFTFPSLYVFFPEDGHGLQTNSGAPIAANLFDVQTWRRLGLSVFAPTRKALLQETAEAYLAEALLRARLFRQGLVAQAVNYPPILVVSSQSTPTLMHLVQDGPKSVDGWDFETAPRVPGDGRVAYLDSLPPVGIPHRVLLSLHEHSALLNDPGVIAAIEQL